MTLTAPQERNPVSPLAQEAAHRAYLGVDLKLSLAPPGLNLPRAPLDLNLPPPGMDLNLSLAPPGLNLPRAPLDLNLPPQDWI